ncbi:radical SAM family heme chaperone HemW [Pseudactinotalea sp. Z1732]|uniref:radical SAM family heme chaperone HemW n=1 Tax=Pseudactinotalea sp. Z1732 TaxID=3413026 RepID=UPI003C7C63DA
MSTERSHELDLAGAATGSADRDFGVYLHIPFCAVRCGYCDFNTYTATELGGGASQDAYAGTAIAEIDLARAAMDAARIPAREVRTVFFGGGTPTLLPAADLVAMLQAVRQAWSLAPDAEITTEANPDSVTPQALAELAGAGFTRVSFGMQSAVPHVLATLDRTHDPARVPEAVAWARQAGLSVSLDLIYGTPGESLADWEESLRVAIAMAPDHVSAYALVVEPGTRMATQVRRGELSMPDDDDEADKYELASAMLTRAGYEWYEISNWSRGASQQCRHNIAYWRSQDWWGVGPGAHSHIGGQRWWNLKHPRPYAAAVEAGRLPVAGQEHLSAPQRRAEEVLLGVRLAQGFPVTDSAVLEGLVAEGLAQKLPARQGMLVLTVRGRLLADSVVHRVLG